MRQFNAFGQSGGARGVVDHCTGVLILGPRHRIRRAAPDLVVVLPQHELLRLQGLACREMPGTPVWSSEHSDIPLGCDGDSAAPDGSSRHRRAARPCNESVVLGEDDDQVWGSTADPVPWAEDENASAVINYTSGTTGLPKGVLNCRIGTFG